MSPISRYLITQMVYAHFLRDIIIESIAIEPSNSKVLSMCDSLLDYSADHAEKRFMLLDGRYYGKE